MHTNKLEMKEKFSWNINANALIKTWCKFSQVYPEEKKEKFKKA